MCTVSFLPSPQGFYLAMNRDEKRDRFSALLPEIVEFEGHRVLFPREPTGGTWISANDAGVCLALINWHRIKREPNNGVRSRGEVIRKLVGISTSHEISTAVRKLPLRKLRPFRLIAIVSAENRVIEWRWNLNRLSVRKHSWESRHWFSSSFDEETAAAERTRVCAAQLDESAKRDVKWLRRLHRSHEPERGPFSICMHRPTNATVSYTEVAVSGRSVVMCYKDGPPCSRRSTTTKICKLSRVRTTNR
jgi:transport and Golgi organization protein 2